MDAWPINRLMKERQGENFKAYFKKQDGPKL